MSSSSEVLWAILGDSTNNTTKHHLCTTWKERQRLFLQPKPGRAPHHKPFVLVLLFFFNGRRKVPLLQVGLAWNKRRPSGSSQLRISWCLHPWLSTNTGVNLAGAWCLLPTTRGSLCLLPRDCCLLGYLSWLTISPQPPSQGRMTRKSIVQPSRLFPHLLPSWQQLWQRQSGAETVLKSPIEPVC